jgi:hypothetical protein
VEKTKIIQEKEQKPLSRNLTPRKQFSLQEGFLFEAALEKAFLKLLF